MAVTDRITKTADVLGGKARLESERIAVVDIVEQLQAGQTRDAVAESLNITLDDVEAAEAYWREHPDEIAADQQARDELYEELQESSRAPSS